MKSIVLIVISEKYKKMPGLIKSKGFDPSWLKQVENGVIFEMVFINKLFEN